MIPVRRNRDAPRCRASELPECRGAADGAGQMQQIWSLVCAMCESLKLWNSFEHGEFSVFLCPINATLINESLDGSGNAKIFHQQNSSFNYYEACVAIHVSAYWFSVSRKCFTLFTIQPF